MARKPVVPKTKSKSVDPRKAPGSPYGNSPKGGRPDNGNSYRDGAPASLNACPVCYGSGTYNGTPCRTCQGSGVAPVTTGVKPASGV